MSSSEYMQSVEMRTREMEKREMILAETLVCGFSIRFQRHLWYLIEWIFKIVIYEMAFFCLNKLYSNLWYLCGPKSKLIPWTRAKESNRIQIDTLHKGLLQSIPPPPPPLLPVSSSSPYIACLWRYGLKRKCYLVNCVLLTATVLWFTASLDECVVHWFLILGPDWKDAGYRYFLLKDPPACWYSLKLAQQIQIWPAKCGSTPSP